MIPSEIKFKTGFENSGKCYGDIQASGNIRNILSAIVTYFKDINPNGHTNTHHGCTIHLLNYPLNIVIGQFGTTSRAENNKLGIVFDGGGHWYSEINQFGNSDSKERVLTMDNKNGILKILYELLDINPFFDKWNHAKPSTSFSVVLNVEVNWTQHEHGDKEYKQEIISMVKKLNVLAKSFSVLTS